MRSRAIVAATRLKKNPEKEPALAVGSATATVAGVLSIIIALFPDLLTERQTAVIMVIGAIVVPLVSAVLIRGRVWSPASVLDLIAETIAEGQAELQKSPAFKDILNTPQKPLE